MAKVMWGSVCRTQTNSGIPGGKALRDTSTGKGVDSTASHPEIGHLQGIRVELNMITEQTYRTVFGSESKMQMDGCQRM